MSGTVERFMRPISSRFTIIRPFKSLWFGESEFEGQRFDFAQRKGSDAVLCIPIFKLISSTVASKAGTSNRQTFDTGLGLA